MNTKNINFLKQGTGAFTLAEGGHSPLLCGDGSHRLLLCGDGYAYVHHASIQ